MRTDDRDHESMPQAPEVPGRRRHTLSLFVGAGAATVLAFALRSERPDRDTPDVRPVGLELNSAGDYVVQGTRGHGRLLFSDGSRVIAGRGARLRLAPVTAEAVGVVLVNGELHVSIESGSQESGTRTWTIDAGPYTMHSRGGELSLAWLLDLRRFALRLDKGSLEFEGPGFSPARSIKAGEKLWLDDRGRSLRPDPG